ncbi:MAG: iron-sulfur cluster assembly scaffold protein [Pyrinomonadaceae bacterium]
MIYPEKIAKRLARLTYAGRRAENNATGTEANFGCGCFVRFSLAIDVENAVVADAAFWSNGCGFMLAAADLLAESVINKRLVDLHGLAADELSIVVSNDLGVFPDERLACADACIKGLRSAFADFRAHQIEEFRGEKALICTCFGVTQETIEMCIHENSLDSVDDVTGICNAGGGCGSCRMLIQEMLDNREQPVGSDIFVL